MNFLGCEIQEELERLQKRLAEAEADETARRKPTDDKATKGTMVVEGLVIDEWVWCSDFVKPGHVPGLECSCAHDHSCVFAIPVCTVTEPLNCQIYKGRHSTWLSSFVKSGDWNEM